MLEILQSYTSPELKKMIRSANITNYSKLKKDGLIELMLRPEHIERFKDIQPKSKRLPPNATDKAEKLKAQLNREFKKKSKPYQQKKAFVEDSKKIEKQMAEKMKKLREKKKEKALKLKQAPPEKKKRKYTKKPKPLLKGQKLIPELINQ